MKKGIKVIVRDQTAGVHFGILDSYDLEKKTCTLKKARKIWYWTHAGSCHGLAAYGPGDGSKIAPLVASVATCNVIEIVECSTVAAKKINAYPEWRP